MDPPQNSRKQIGEIREVPYWGPTNSRCHCTRFVFHGELAHGICALLLKSNAFPFKQMSYTYSSRNYCKLAILFLILNSEAKEQLTKYVNYLWQGAIFFLFTCLRAAYMFSPLHSFIWRVQSYTDETEGVNRTFHIYGRKGMWFKSIFWLRSSNSGLSHLYFVFNFGVMGLVSSFMRRKLRFNEAAQLWVMSEILLN
jgi:hypothetical protein